MALAGYEDASLQLILEVEVSIDERGAKSIASLIERAFPRLAFSNPSFAKALIRRFTGESRGLIVRAFAVQARRYGRGGVFAGRIEDFEAQQAREFAAKVEVFPDEAGLEDLAKELRKFT